MRTKRQKKRAEGEVREPRCTRDKCNVCCKSFAAFLFSTVGLVIMVAAYSVAGGFLFRAIEETYEHQSIEAGRADVQNITDQTVMQLWETTRRLNILYPENWTAEAHIVFTRYQRDIYRVVTGSKPLMEWDGGKVGDEIHTKWNFAGALLYAVTAITTIGYGHVTPKTSTGMACTIVYCVFGLPLTLMCVANLGKFFARVFRILYHTCCCGVCCIFCLSCKRRKAASKMTRRPNQNGGVDAAENGQTLIMSNDPNSGVNRPSRKYSFTITKGQIWLQNVKKQFSLSLKDDVTVPVYLCLVVMAIYIFSGALLFALWDGWNYMEGAYFCFVTLTTIGFGDYVPGMIQQNTTDKSSTERLVLCTIYVFLGLALVGMCIDLMQADILQKIAWIGRKIGIAGNSKNAKLNAGATHSTVIQTAEGLPDNKPVIRVQIDQPASSDVIEYEQETNLAKHNRPMCKTDKPPIVSVHSKGSSKKVKKVTEMKKL
ncbi:potassium channel subfamily K member 9-like isoform X2 [Watersipora subatra]|uniref:potassium channel subfamily K member 9-like isoform X2 n=1 Tax=Watersipora subatra TaxID=2589382 RepID=UPI00355BA85C